MAWSYRSDLADETYHEPGVTMVEGEKLPDTPRDSEHGKLMVKGEKDKPDKDARITEHQEFPGQNVPRFVKESDEEKKAREDAEKDKGRLLVPDPAEAQKATESEKALRSNEDRQRIRAEEQKRVQDEEREKDLEKIRKEESENAKKSATATTSHSATANKK